MTKNFEPLAERANMVFGPSECKTESVGLANLAAPRRYDGEMNRIFPCANLLSVNAKKHRYLSRVEREKRHRIFINNLLKRNVNHFVETYKLYSIGYAV